MLTSYQGTEHYTSSTNNMGNKYIFNNNNSHETNDNTATIVTVSGQFNELTTSQVTEAEPQHATTENFKESEQNVWQKIFSWRAFIVLMMHSAYALHSITMIIAPYVLVCMCRPIQGSNMNISSNTTINFKLSQYSNLTGNEDELLLQEKSYEFDWDYQTRGLVLTSNYFVAFMAPLLANAIRGYIGNKTTLVAMTLILAGLNFLSPVTARVNVYIFLAVRVLVGLVVNSQMPIAGDMLAWWIPASEKLTAVTIVMAGWNTGGLIAPIVSGFLCALPIDGGWPFVFYFAGAIAVLWSVAITFLSSRKPEKHPFISDKEKAYIISTRAGLGHNSTSTRKADRPPYRSIFSSIPVISFTVAEVAHFFNIFIIAACSPVYLASVLKFSIQEVGLITGVIWVFRFPASLFWTVFGNWLLRFQSIGTNGSRKICYGLGQALSCVFSLGIAFCDEQDKWLACGLLLICASSATFGTSILGLVPLDMAPRYAGFLTSLSTSVVFLVSFAGPMFASTVTPKGSLEEWQLIWITMAVIYLASLLLFTVFGSASLQSWAVSSIEIKTEPVQPANAYISQNETKSFNKCAESLQQ